MIFSIFELTVSIVSADFFILPGDLNGIILMIKDNRDLQADLLP
jgi:hypothetical protein